MTVRVLRESLTRKGSRRRSLFISAMVALWMATSLPAAPIAMPMSPAASAGRIVHAVADHGHLVALGLDGAHKIHLVLRQTIALGLFAADFRRHARGHGLAVAGNHGNAAHAGFLQFRQGFLGLGAGLVLHAHPADALAVARHENQAPAFGVIHVHGFFEAAGRCRYP